MQIEKLGIVVFSCLLVVLIADIPISSAYAEKQKSSGTNQVYILGCEKGACFSPCQTVILKGDTMTWANQDSIIHMIVSGSGQNGPDGWFSSSFIPPHGTFSHKFERTGAFVYYDILHPSAQGVIIVSSSMNSSYVYLEQSFFSDWCSR